MHRKRTSLLVVLALVAGLILTVGIGPANAVIATNACRNTAVPTDSTQLDVDWTATAPASVTIGDPVLLSNINMVLALPGSLFVAGYNLGLLPVGPNTVPGFVAATIEGTNTVEGTQNTNVASVSVSFTITDPDGIAGTGDETATPASIPTTFADMTWTDNGSGNMILFREDTYALNAAAINNNMSPDNPAAGPIRIDSVIQGFLHVKFACEPGTVDVSPNPTQVFPIDPAPEFASTAVVAPPTAPVCVNETTSVGVTQTVPINLTDNCTDVNGNIDLTTFSVSALSPNAGTLTGSNGLYSYTAPASDPGAPVTFTFTVADSGGLVSNTATTSITILANQCDATSGPCSLTEIIVQPVVGTTMTMDKVQGMVVMSPIVLNGQPQVSSGSLQDLTVTNARGTAAGWNVTAYVTDLGAPGAPTIEPIPGVVIATCSLAGGGGSPHYLCIPGDNMGWSPTAAIAHDVIPGDVAQVSAGPAHAADAAAWLATLIGAGYGPYTAGLGGLATSDNLLCSSPAEHSGGTFSCDAALWLGVPASAGAGIYTGGLVLTLV